jgi:alpha-tubulin suppressor-like RCC1 family protein
LSARGQITSAIKKDGTLWLWGYGYNGALGNNAVTNRSSPIQTISGGTNWRSVTTGNNLGTAAVTAATKTDGTLWLWGIGSNGELGDNSITSKSSPIQTISGGTNWRLVSLGGRQVATIREDCW